MTLKCPKIMCITMGLIATGLIVALGLRDTRPVLVCFGDSLTTCGRKGGRYSDWLAQQLSHIRVVNAGVGEDTLEQGRHRFKNEVLRHCPAVVLIAMGANDFWKAMRAVSALRSDLEGIVMAAQATGAKVVVASCFGDRSFWDEV